MNWWYALIDILPSAAWLEPIFMRNALLAIILAAPLFGGMGSFVVSNRMAFFSDAIGHSALTGVAIGLLIGIKDPIFSKVKLLQILSSVFFLQQLLH